WWRWWCPSKARCWTKPKCSQASKAAWPTSRSPSASISCRNWCATPWARCKKTPCASNTSNYEGGMPAIPTLSKETGTRDEATGPRRAITSFQAIRIQSSTHPKEDLPVNKRFAIAAAAVLSALAVTSTAHAAWPERPITIIVPFPAGGGTDTFARPLAQQLGQQLGQSVVVDNRGGAGGTLGAGVAARAPADGYTFFMGGAHHVVAPSIYKKLAYDIQKDFTPVALLAQPPQIIVVNPKNLPINSLKEFIEKAKADPESINFGSAGMGSTHHLAGELFSLKTGIKLTHVPYQGAGPMLSALISGQVDVGFDGLGSSA